MAPAGTNTHQVKQLRITQTSFRKLDRMVSRDVQRPSRVLADVREDRAAKAQGASREPRATSEPLKIGSGTRDISGASS